MFFPRHIGPPGISPRMGGPRGPGMGPGGMGPMGPGYPSNMRGAPPSSMGVPVGMPPMTMAGGPRQPWPPNTSTVGDSFFPYRSL